MDSINTHLTLLVIIGSILCLFSLHIRNKFKNAVYHISKQSQAGNNDFYIVIEWKHGKYRDARRLSRFNFFFIPNHIASSLKGTYQNFDIALLELNNVKHNRKI